MVENATDTLLFPEPSESNIDSVLFPEPSGSDIDSVLFSEPSESDIDSVLFSEPSGSDIDSALFPEPSGSDIDSVLGLGQRSGVPFKSPFRNSTANKWDIATDQMMGSMYKTLGMFSELFDAPETAEDFRKTAVDYEKAAASKPKPDVSMSITDEGEKILDKFSEGEILGAITDTAEYVHSVLTGAAPSLLATGAAVGAGAFVAPVLGVAGIPALLTTSVVGLTPGLLLSGGEIHDEAIKYGADPDEAKALGIGAGTVYGLLDRLGMAFVLNGITRKLGKDLTIKTIEKQTGLPEKTITAAVEKGIKVGEAGADTNKLAAALNVKDLASLKKARELTAEKLGAKTIRGEALKGAGRGFIGEAGTEAMQTVVEEVSPTLISEKEVDLADLAKKTFDSFAAGGIAGAHFAAPMSGMSVPVARQAMNKYNQDVKATEEISKGIEEADKASDIVQPKRAALREQDETRGVYDGIEDIDLIRNRLQVLEKIKKNKRTKEQKAEIKELERTLKNRTGADYFQPVKNLVSRSLSPLRGIRNSSPIVNQMVGRLENFFVNGNALIGRYLTVQQDIENDIRKSFKLPFQSPVIKKYSEQVSEILHGIEKEGTTYDPIVVATAKKYRTLYNDLYTFLTDNKVELNKDSNYLTRIYKIRSKKDRRKFRDALIKAGRSRIAATEIVDNIVSNDNVYVPEGDINIFTPQGGIVNPNSREISVEKERELTTEEVKAIDEVGLLEKDVSNITKKYIVNAVRRGLLKNFVETYNPVLNRLYSSQVMTREELQRIKDVVDAMQHKYKSITSPLLRTGYRFINTSTYILTLPLAAITALTEPFIVLHRVKPQNALLGAIDASVATLRQGVRTFVPNFKRSENEKALLSLFQTADLSIQDALRDIGDSAVSRRVTDKFFRINLLAQVTQFSRNLALQAARRQTADDIKVLAEEAITGNVTKKTMQARKRLTIQGLANVIPQIDSKTQTFKPATDIQLEVMRWASDPELKNPPEIVTKALGTVVDEVIMTPNVVNKPLWMSNPYLSPIAQLKGFMMVFGNTVGMRLYKDVFQPLYKGRLEAGEIAKYAMMFTILVAGILGTQTIKNGIRYGDEESPWDDLNGYEKMFSAILQSNIFGYGNSIIEALRADRYGSSPLVTLLGPAASKSSKLVQALGTGDPKKIAKGLTRITPIASSIPLARLEDVFEDIFDD